MRRFEAGVTAPPSPSGEGVVRSLAAAEFLQGLGASAVLPMLPLFLRRTGESTTAVGVVMAAFFAAGVLTPYIAGHVADRFGHRRVILAGLGAYALASVVFIAPVHTGGYLACRAVQGLGASAVQVGGLALVGVVVEPSRRGRAFARVFGAQLLGMAVGPLLGSVAGVAHVRAVFVATAAAAIAATIPVRRGAPSYVPDHSRPMASLAVSRALVGVLMLGIAGGAVVGVYETCWSLLLISRQASSWQIGLSWTLFAAPFAAFSPVAGRITDRVDGRWLAVTGMVMTAGFAASYPFIPSVAALVGLGALEAVGVAIAMPATQSLLARTTGPDALGRAQGLFGTAETAAMAAAAGTSGYLFSLTRWAPFLAAAAVATALSLSVPVLCRRLPGRTGPDASSEIPVIVAGDSTLSAAPAVRP